MSKFICPECDEPVVNRAPHRGSRTGWALNVEPRRLEWSHEDGEPLCPVVIKDGYQPALPIKR